MRSTTRGAPPAGALTISGDLPPKETSSMSDHPTSTLAVSPPRPETPFDPDRSLRVTFLTMLCKRDQRLLSGLCGSMLELTREARMLVKDIPGDAMATDLRAAAADLRYLAGYLAYTGASEGNCLERWERELGDVAERLAERVAEIAGELEAALDAIPPAK